MRLASGHPTRAFLVLLQAQSIYSFCSLRRHRAREPALHRPGGRLGVQHREEGQPEGVKETR